MDLKGYFRIHPDWPKEGVNFVDIMPLLRDHKAFDYTVNTMAQHCYDNVDIGLDYVAGMEARGFIFAPALAHKLGVGFVPIRKKGKLPGLVVRKGYNLEYGQDEIEIESGIVKGRKLIFCDDLLATGGTAQAATELIRKEKGYIWNAIFLVELGFLNGRERLKAMDIKVHPLVGYDTDEELTMQWESQQKK